MAVRYAREQRSERGFTRALAAACTALENGSFETADSLFATAFAIGKALGKSPDELTTLRAGWWEAISRSRARPVGRYCLECEPSRDHGPTEAVGPSDDAKSVSPCAPRGD